MTEWFRDRALKDSRIFCTLGLYRKQNTKDRIPRQVLYSVGYGYTTIHTCIAGLDG